MPDFSSNNVAGNPPTMVDKKKNDRSRFRQQVRRTAQTSASRTSATNTSDQRQGDARDTRDSQQSDDASRDLDVLEQRVLGAVRGAVTDVLKENQQHPDLPYIDMDFMATDVSEKQSRSATSDEILLQPQYVDRSDTNFIPSGIKTEPTISPIKLGSTVMAGLITGLVIAVTFGFVPLPFNNTTDAQKIKNHDANDGAVAGLQNNSQSIRSMPAYSTPSTKPPKLKQIQQSQSDQTNPQINVLPAKQGPRSGISKPDLSIEKNWNAQLPTSIGTKIKVRQALKEVTEAGNAAQSSMPPMPKPMPNKSAYIGQQIVLRIKGGTIEVAGKLKDYDADKYIIALPNAKILKVRTDLYDCVSANCPKFTN